MYVCMYVCIYIYIYRESTRHIKIRTLPTHHGFWNARVMGLVTTMWGSLGPLLRKVQPQLFMEAANNGRDLRPFEKPSAPRTQEAPVLSGILQPVLEPASA